MPIGRLWSKRFRRALGPRRQGAGGSQVSEGAAFFHGSQHHLASVAGGVWQLEQRLEAVLAAEPEGRFRGDARPFGGDERHRSPRPDGRFDDRARPCFGSGRKRGQKGQALGRSRGGFSTKIHLKFDFDGLPLTFHLTDIGPDITPRAVLSDKGDGAKANREAARRRGICPAIPYRENAVAKPAFFPKTLYKGPARVEDAPLCLSRYAATSPTERSRLSRAETSLGR